MKCKICNSSNISKISYDKSLNNSTPVAVSIFSGNIIFCNSCGYGNMETPPSDAELKDYYTNQYWSTRPSMTNNAIKNEQSYKEDPRAITQIELTIKHLNKNTVNAFEIGAGSAYPLLYLRERLLRSKTNLYVCEPGKQWDHYYESADITKIADYFPCDSDIKFNYIHMSHWLSHIISLDAIMPRIHDIANKGCILFIEQPNTEHDYWKLPIQNSPHIHFFSRVSLEKLFQQHGFECLSMGEYGITFNELIEEARSIKDCFTANKNGVWIRGVFRKV